MAAIGARCHELRLDDAGVSWRIFYRIDRDAIVILDVLRKKTCSTPRGVIEVCRRRLLDYDRIV
jgi:phage-related protein